MSTAAIDTAAIDATAALRDLVDAASRRGHAPLVTRGLNRNRELPDLVECACDRVLVVASTRAVASVPGVRALLANGAVGYHRVHANPTTGQALALSAVIDRLRPRVVVAVGGGSAIDLAKSARLLRPTRRALRAGLAGDPRALRGNPPDLLAVPTTAGSGSEVTPFATLYHNGGKVSLDVPDARPDHVLLDGRLVASCPPSVAAAAVLDALCHSVESTWSRHATASSRGYAAAATEALVRCVTPRQPLTGHLDADQGEQRLLAATIAGLAIAQTRTTAAHAFSYWLTARRGTAHGFACALNLGWLARHNWAARGEGQGQGQGELERVLRQLGCHPGAAANAPVPTAARVLAEAQFAGLFEPSRLTDSELSSYVAAGLSMRARADRNPVPLDPERVREQIIASGFLTAPSETTRLRGHEVGRPTE